MKVTAHRLKDHSFATWHTEVEDRWDYARIRGSREWRENWISFDCLCHDPEGQAVYAGVASLAADIFHGFDLREKRFFPTGYDRVADPFDAKFHRSLERWNGDGCLYGAVALLHDVDQYFAAPGGAIVRYDPRTRDIRKVGIPIPHVYIQSTVIDQDRGVLYGQTFTPERLFSFDLQTHAARDLGPLGSGIQMGQAETLVLDDRGRVWGSWGLTRAWQNAPGVDALRLFRYDPAVGRIEYLAVGLPRRDGQHGFEKPEALFNLGTGCLYASGGNGSLYRIDTESLEIRYLGTPIPDRPSRLASLALAADGNAYGVTGRAGATDLLCFDPRTDAWRLLGPVCADDGTRPYQIHQVIAVGERRFFAGENDNPRRSSWLWEIEL
jgi:hypothetical protein